MKAKATDFGSFAPPGGSGGAGDGRAGGEGPAGERDGPEALPKARDDAQTLKEIARAIREGQVLRTRQPQSGAAHLDTPRADQHTQDNAPQVPAPLPPKAALSIPDPAYLAKLAHELKTPLSAIVAAAEIMRDERLGPMGNARYLGYAADVHDSATHALAVITKMLGAAAASRNEPEPEQQVETVDLNELAGRVVSGMMPLARGRALTLEVELEPGLPGALADPTALRQILLNLITNALKFTPAGGDVRVVTGYLDNGGVFLVVRDTGAGIDAATLEALANGAGNEELRKRSGGGYGLGLPTVLSLAEANGAAVQIDSAPGKGTVVLLAFARDRLA